MDRQKEMYGHVMQGSERHAAVINRAEVESQRNATSIEDLLDTLALKHRVFLGSQENLRLISARTPMTDIGWIAIVQALLPKDTYLDYPARFGDNPVPGAAVRGLNGRKLECQGIIYVVKKESCQHVHTGGYLLRYDTKPLSHMPVLARHLRHPLYDQDSGRILNLQKL